jgi:Ca2+/H+ antiporter
VTKPHTKACTTQPCITPKQLPHRVGVPFGSLVLAVAVTVIEVALTVTLIATGGPRSHSLARNTVFAAVMITANGIVGMALVVGAMRHGITGFNPEGSVAHFTSSGPGPERVSRQSAWLIFRLRDG